MSNDDRIVTDVLPDCGSIACSVSTVPSRAGTIISVASSQPATAWTRPVTSPPATVGSVRSPRSIVVSGTVSTATAEPSTSVRTRSPAPQDTRTRVAITDEVRKGMGATTRPSSSMTTATSREVAPPPPSDSSMPRPASSMASLTARHASDATDVSPS